MLSMQRLYLGVGTLLFLSSGAVFSQTVSIVSGNGQIVCPLCTTGGVKTFDPLVVIVKDAAGNPIPNVAVSWTATSGTTTPTLLAAQTTTDAAGQTSNTLQMPPPLGTSFVGYAQGTITASVGASSVSFTETVAVTDPTTGVNQVQVAVQSPAPGTTITGPSGGQADTPVQVAVTSLQGSPVSGVELRLVNPASVTRTATCASQPGITPGTVLTDATGSAICNVILSGPPGSGQFTIAVGGKFAQFTTPIRFNVTPGLPGMIKLLSGNNQSGNAGARLPGPLVAEVDDQAGIPLSGQNVIWQVTQGTATLFNTVSTSDANGRVSTGVTLGNTAGPVQITVSVANNPAIAFAFTATINITVTDIQKLSGDGQTTPINTPFANQLVVQVNNSGQPVPGVGVQFVVSSGTATLDTPSATTNAQGQASTGVTAGAQAGPVAVTATVSLPSGNLTQSFSLTVRRPGPNISSNSFYNAAGFQQGSLSPCSLATIIGSGLAPDIQGVVMPLFFGPLPLLLANTTIQVGPSYAPIHHVSHIGEQESVSFQVPCDAALGTVPVTVRVGIDSTTVNVPITAVSPGIFLTTMSDSKQRAVLVRPDGSFVSLQNPARRGEVIRMYATGLGQTTPPVGTNQVGIPGTDQPITASIVVGVNNGGVRVVSAKYASNMIGVYEVAFEVPSDAPPGNDLPFAIAVVQGGNLVFGNGTTIPVQ